MKKQPKARTLKIRKDNEEWKIQQQFAAFAERLDRLPDANEVRRNALRSAPIELTAMLF